MAKEISVTFKMDEAMACWFNKSVCQLDKTKSEVIRTCILLSLDTVKACPTLTNRIQFEDRSR